MPQLPETLQLLGQDGFNVFGKFEDFPFTATWKYVPSQAYVSESWHVYFSMWRDAESIEKKEEPSQIILQIGVHYSVTQILTAVHQKLWTMAETLKG